VPRFLIVELNRFIFESWLSFNNFHEPLILLMAGYGKIIPVMKKENLILTISTIALGLFVGMSSLFLSLFLTFIEEGFLHFKETPLRPIITGSPNDARLFSVFIGGIIAAVIWWILRTKVKPPVTIGKGLAGENMPAVQTILHVMTQIFYVGTGGSIGRELAPREAGAMIAQKWNNLLNRLHWGRLSKDDVALLIASAAGAGFAGVYNAPMTGMFFCVEVLFKKISIRSVCVSLPMSVIAALVSSSVRGTEPYYLVGKAQFEPKFLWIAIFISLLCGIVGALFRKSFTWAESVKPDNYHILWQLPLLSLITGLISINFPQIMGNGRALAQFSISTTGRNFLLVLLLGAVAKYAVTVFTIRAGAFGGTLTPSVAIGAAIGAFIGIVIFPYVGMPIWQCALLGGCSLLAASQQAPLMALFMVFEVCHLNSMALIPLGMGVAISVAISRVVLRKVM
jgi:H+/Cl- antiporter ClcA